MKKILIAAVVLVVIGMIASSGSTPPATSENAVAAPAGSVADAAVAAAPVDRWSYSQEKNEMDGSTTTSVGIDATGTIEGWLSTTTPRLIIRCKEKETNLFVITGVKAQPELGEFQRATVRLRYGSAQPVSQKWSESTDGDALFAGSPLAVAKRLASVDTVRFEFTPFNSNPAIATFVVTGLRPHLERLASACSWKL